MKKITEIGKRWERKLATRLSGKRQPNSGAFGTQHGEMKLTGDVVVSYPWWHIPLLIECKFGYGGSKQMALRREWFEKIRQEAKLANRYPAVAIKFRDVTGGDIESSEVICINIDTWEQLMKELEYLYLEYLSMLKERYEKDEPRTNG